MCESPHPDAWVFSLTDGSGLRSVELAELRFLKAVGALSARANSGRLISVDRAIMACGKLGVAAPVLAAMAGIPDLQPYTAPPHGAHPLLSLGVACYLQFLMRLILYT